jgi:hypothetical protein
MRGIANAEFGAGIRRRRGERGQTILLVAVSIVSLLAMAALAIDVVTLYVASTEIQRSADTAALAGAKAIADSGVTTLQPSDGNLVAAETLAQSMATSAINAIVQASPAVNQVAGGSPVLVGTPTIVWGSGANPNSNPYITVTLQQTNLPTFFAKVFGSKSAIATASATAEAYNPANLQSFTPIQTTCVKPWLIGNADPSQLPAIVNFVAPATGLVENPAPIGKTFWLNSACTATAGGADSCSFPPNPLGVGKVQGLPYVQFLPLEPTANGGDVCPPSTASPCGAGNDPAYKAVEECCNITPYTCGGTAFNANWTPTLDPGYKGRKSDLAEGTECLIHASNTGLGQGQDTLDWSTAAFPTGPPVIKSNSGPQSGNFVSTSSSIVTIPILAGTGFVNSLPYQVTVVGFLQAFVNEVDMGPGVQFVNHHGDVQITVMNVIGCSSQETNGAPGNGQSPVVGGNGASPLPVRLITTP